MHVEDELSWVHCLDKSLQFSVIRVRRVGHLEVEWQVLIVFVIPTRENDKDCRLFAVALINATNKENECVRNENLSIIRKG